MSWQGYQSISHGELNEEEEEEEEVEIILFDECFSIVTDNIFKENRTTVSGDYN